MARKQLAIIDYGMGNLHSVASAVRLIAPDVEVTISADPKVIEAADHVIFPGVGAIRDCMAGIMEIGADQMVADALQAQKPVLGICVGMQALVQRSSENNGVDCLGVLPGEVIRFPADTKDTDGSTIRVPHMGWNHVQQTLNHPLWRNIEQGARFYFVHSYCVGGEIDNMAARCEYGIPFAAALAKDSLFAVQFHPEKSHYDGLQLLKNFVAWDGKP